MRNLRLLVLLLVLSGSVAFAQPIAAQQPSENLVDLAAMPLGPDQLPEAGYLVEGGGFFSDAEQVAQFHGTPGGSGTNQSDIAGTLLEINWRRSYMYRTMLVADAENPASDLLADEITLLHAFDDARDASKAATMIDEFWRNSGDEIQGEDESPTYRYIADSADSLVSTVAVQRVVVEIVSTDFERRLDIANHEAIVAATITRVSSVLNDTERSLATTAVYVEGMKQLSFFDSPDSFQHYSVRDGRWLSPHVSTEMGVPQGLMSAYQSQQVVTLNSQSQIVVQVWLGSFDSAESGEAFANRPEDLADIVPMFGEQVADAEPQTVEGVDIFRVSGSVPDGVLGTGYRSYVLGDEGTTVGIVALIGSGNVLIDPADMEALTTAQQDCLDGDTGCASLSLDDIIVANADGQTPLASQEGIYTDPQFGWSVDYAEAGWEFSNLEGEQILELRNDRSLASIETVVDRHGDPTQCILDEVRLLEAFEDHAYITLGSDVEDEPRAGNEPGHVWAIYTVEPLADERADQEYSIRIDCFTLIEGDASLVVHHSAPRDLWESESAKGDDLRANIDISGDAAVTSYGTDAQARNVDTMFPRIWIPLAA